MAKVSRIELINEFNRIHYPPEKLAKFIKLSVRKKELTILDLNEYLGWPDSINFLELFGKDDKYYKFRAGILNLIIVEAGLEDTNQIKDLSNAFYAKSENMITDEDLSLHLNHTERIYICSQFREDEPSDETLFALHAGISNSALVSCQLADMSGVEKCDDLIYRLFKSIYYES